MSFYVKNCFTNPPKCGREPVWAKVKQLHAARHFTNLSTLLGQKLLSLFSVQKTCANVIHKCHHFTAHAIIDVISATRCAVLVPSRLKEGQGP